LALTMPQDTPHEKRSTAIARNAHVGQVDFVS
jgi:hypothetical protein